MVIGGILFYALLILVMAALLADTLNGTIDQPWRGILSLLAAIIWPVTLVVVILVGALVVIFEKD